MQNSAVIERRALAQNQKFCFRHAGVLSLGFYRNSGTVTEVTLHTVKYITVCDLQVLSK